MGFRKSSTAKTRRTDLAIGVLNQSVAVQDVLREFFPNAPIIPEMKMVEIKESNRKLMKDVRIVMEHKSVITAHRNRGNRSDELVSVADVLSEACPNAILVATVMIGTAAEVLNYEVLQRAESVLQVFCEKVRGGYELDELKKLLGRGSPELQKFLNQPHIRESLISTNESQESLRELVNYKFHTNSIPWKDLFLNAYDETGIAFDLVCGFIREISDALGNRNNLGPIIYYITGRITETLTDDLMPLYLSLDDERRVTAYLKEKDFV